MEAAHHRPQGDRQGAGDLLVRHLLDQRHHHHRAILLGEGVEGLLDLGVEHPVHHDLLRGRGLVIVEEVLVHHPLVDRLDLLEIDLFGANLGGPVPVDEGIP